MIRQQKNDNNNKKIATKNVVTKKQPIIFGSYCLFSHEIINCFLIRHAQSQFNSQFQICSTQLLSQSFQFNNDMIDCTITEEGVRQIQNIDLKLSNQYNQQIKIDCIFVSPLQRALQTTQQLLKIHNINPKQVIILANLTQIVSKICDLMGDPQKTIKKYPNYNFTYFKQFIQDNEQNWQDMLIKQNYHHLINNNQQYAFRYLNLLQSIFPQSLQSSNDCYKRSMKVINEIKTICLQYQFKNIIIISHNRILKYISGKQQGGKVPGLLNCQLRHVYI